MNTRERITTLENRLKRLNSQKSESEDFDENLALDIYETEELIRFLWHQDEYEMLGLI